jgi:hypothetical protein
MHALHTNDSFEVFPDATFDTTVYPDATLTDLDSTIVAERAAARDRDRAAELHREIFATFDAPATALPAIGPTSAELAALQEVPFEQFDQHLRMLDIAAAQFLTELEHDVRVDVFTDEIPVPVDELADRRHGDDEVLEWAA